MQLLFFNALSVSERRHLSARVIERVQRVASFAIIKYETSI